MIKETKVLGKAQAWSCSETAVPTSHQRLKWSRNQPKGFESRRPPPTSWMRALCRSTLRAFMILTIAACKYILRSSSTALLVCSISCWSDRCATSFELATRLANNTVTAKLEKDGFVWPVVCLSALMLWSWTLSFYWWNSYLVKTWTRFQSPPAGGGGEKEYISPLVWRINRGCSGLNRASWFNQTSQYPNIHCKLQNRMLSAGGSTSNSRPFPSRGWASWRPAGTWWSSVAPSRSSGCRPAAPCRSPSGCC